MKRYCLADYILTADIPNSLGFGTSSVSIGGEGSYLDSISVSIDANMFETTADATGSWVHKKTLDRHGSVTVTINQMSDKVAIFKALMNVYAKTTSDVEGMTLALRDSMNNTICICNDCLLTKIPDQSFASDPGTQAWTFTCGEILYI